MSSKNKAATAKEEAKPALVPKLRFPRFQDADAWEPTIIGALGRFYYGKSAPKWSLAEDAPTPCVRYGELYTKFGPVITETYSRTNTAPEKLRFSKGGEILIPRVGEKPEDFGKCCAYLPIKGIAIGEMISVLETRQHPLFYTYYFRNLYKQFAKVVEGQNVKNLYFTELEPLPIHRPSLPEQQKIAECLSSVDELMAAQARKVDALKTHKKWLMQQLFPGEGKTFPSLRLPEFQGEEGWKSLPLAALADKIMVGIASAATHAYRETGVPMLRNQNIKEGGIDDSSLLFIDPIYEATHKNKRLKAGDVITVRTGYPGLSAVVTKSYENAQCFTSLITRPKADILDSNYLCLYINSPIGKKFMLGAEAGGAQKNVNAGTLETLEVYFPQLEEQRKIASILSNFDALISAETQKLEALAIHKKGLTQQLFPSAEGIDA